MTPLTLDSSAKVLQHKYQKICLLNKENCATQKVKAIYLVKPAEMLLYYAFIVSLEGLYL